MPTSETDPDMTSDSLPTPPPACCLRRPRWVYLYLALAGLVLASILVGAIVNQALTGLTLQWQAQPGTPLDVALIRAERLWHWWLPIGVVLTLLTGSSLFYGWRLARRMARAAAERDESTALLHRSRQYLETITHLTPVGIFRVTPAGKNLFFNQRVQEMLGLSAQALAGTGWQQAVHPDDRQRVFEEFARAAQGGHPFRSEYRIRRPDGATIWVLGQAQPELDPEGRITSLVGTITDITDRHLAQEALGQREREQQAILDNVPDLAWLKDAQGRFLAGNAAFLRACGVAATDLPGKQDHDIWPPELARMYRRYHREVVASGKPKRGTERIALPDGRHHWLEIIKTPIFGDKQRPIGTASIARDVTQQYDLARRRALEVHRLRGLHDLATAMSGANDFERNMDLAVQHIGRTIEADGVLLGLVDRDGGRLRLIAAHGERTAGILRVCFDARASLGGAVMAQGRGRIVPDFFAENGRDTSVDDAMRAEGLVGGLVVPLRRGDRPLGVLYIADRTAHPRTRDDLELAGLVSSLLAAEISRKQAEEVRRTADETLLRLGAALDQINDGVVITDRQGCIEYVNPAFERMTGYPATEVLGQTMRILKSGRQPPEVYARLWQTITAGQVWSGQLINRRKDGSQYSEHCSITPIRDPSGRIVRYLGVKQDVSRAVELERQLHQAQKLEAVGQLAAGIAHEINTPIQYVGDNTNFLQDSFGALLKVTGQYTGLLAQARGHQDLSPLVADIEDTVKALDLEFVTQEIPKAIEQSLEGIERVTQIVRAMKEFSHPDNGEKTQTDLNRAIESTVTVTRNRWKYVADLQLDLDPGLPPVPLYVGEFNQVVLNLITNATDAITDKLGPKPGGKGSIRIATRLDGDWVEVRVADSGTGIPPEVAHRVFDPFFTTKEVGRGTGQGLSIAHVVIVEKHHGRIDFETQVGQGTTFILRLPLIDLPQTDLLARGHLAAAPDALNPPHPPTPERIPA